MRTIIAGSRTITAYRDVLYAVECARSIGDFQISEVISGGARGVDTLAEEFAKSAHIPLRVFPANWDKNGKKAGYIRNVEMADNADALIAIWDGVSRGTKHMIDIAIKKGLKVYIKRYNAGVAHLGEHSICNRKATGS